MKFPIDRLRRAGATEDEIALIRARHEAADGLAKESLLERLASIADQDIRKWLDELRADGHLGPNKEPDLPAEVEVPEGVIPGDAYEEDEQAALAELPPEDLAAHEAADAVDRGDAPKAKQRGSKAKAG